MFLEIAKSYGWWPENLKNGKSGERKILESSHKRYV